MCSNMVTVTETSLQNAECQAEACNLALGINIAINQAGGTLSTGWEGHECLLFPWMEDGCVCVPHCATGKFTFVDLRYLVLPLASIATAIATPTPLLKGFVEENVSLWLKRAAHPCYKGKGKR